MKNEEDYGCHTHLNLNHLNNFLSFKFTTDLMSIRTNYATQEDANENGRIHGRVLQHICVHEHT